jgi:hypothetical protein
VRDERETFQLPISGFARLFFDSLDMAISPDGHGTISITCEPGKCSVLNTSGKAIANPSVYLSQITAATSEADN